MRSAFLVLAVAACATTGNPTTTFRARTTAPVPVVWSSMVATMSQHERVALANPSDSTIVTGATHVDGQDVVYVVRVEEPELDTCKGMLCPTHQIVLTVTPVAFQDRQPVAYDAIPRAARDHVAELLWDLREGLMREHLLR